MTRRRLWPALAAAGAALAAGGWAYAHRIEPRWLRVTQHWLAVPDLPPAFDGYRVVHLSDFHAGTGRFERLLPDAVALANRCQPDLLALTGDFTTARRGGLDTGVAILAGLRARDGVWAVPGNHDRYPGKLARVTAALDRAGIHMLCNAHTVIARERAAANGQRPRPDRLVIAGVDDMIWGVPDLARTLDGAPPDAPVLLLAHEPAYARLARRDPRVFAQLSGHTHGGQLRLPGIGPLLLPTFSGPYHLGAYQVGGLALYVTAGIGTGRIVLRANCRPEIAVITLLRAARPRTGRENGRSLGSDRGWIGHDSRVRLPYKPRPAALRTP